MANEITVDSFVRSEGRRHSRDLIASGVTDITGEASNYSFQSVLSVTRQLGMLGSVEASITFTDGITSPIKEIEYGYWYNYENIVGYEFNKSSVPMVAEAVVSVGPQFANQRDKFMDELCKKITGLGFVSGVSVATHVTLNWWVRTAEQDGLSALSVGRRRSQRALHL